MRSLLLHKGLAMLRAPFPFPLAAGALANYLKLTALRESLSLRDFVAPEALRRPSPPAAGRCKALKNKPALELARRWFVFVLCGE